MRQKFLAGFLIICAAVFLSTPAMAAKFSNVVTFGDSISDNGTTSDPYGFGVYTDGTPWADQLANKHGANMLNVAYGGATTGLGNIYAPPVGTVPADTTGLNWQVNLPTIQAQIAPMAKDTTLFTVWAGANDYNRLMALTGNTATATQKQIAASTAANNIMASLTTLAAQGAEHILVPNLMLLGDGNFAGTYNFLLESSLAAFDAVFVDIEIYTVDMWKLYTDLFAGYDIDNSDPEIAAAERARAMADGYLWEDGYHPGWKTHKAMAELAYEATAPVPEPGTLILVFSGLIGIAGISRRKTA